MAKRGRYSKGEERREEILQAAFDVLSRDGYKKTSLGQIGRAIGLDSAHILYYFSSREALLQEVLQRWDASNTAALEGADAFSAWIEAVRRNETRRGIVQLYTAFAIEAADPAHPAHEYFRDHYATTQRKLADELRRRQIEGLIDQSIDPHGTAGLLISLSDGLQLRWLIDPTIDMAAALRAAIDSLTSRSATSTSK